MIVARRLFGIAVFYALFAAWLYYFPYWAALHALCLILFLLIIEWNE